jgi:hypothetical protein
MVVIKPSVVCQLTKKTSENINKYCNKTSEITYPYVAVHRTESEPEVPVVPVVDSGPTQYEEDGLQGALKRTLTYDAVYGTEGDGENNEPDVPVVPTVDSGHTQEHEDNGF